MERDAAAVRRVKSSGSHDSGSRRNNCTPETRGRDGGDGDEKKRLQQQQQQQQQGRAGAGTGASCLREEVTLVLLAGFACALWALTRASLHQLLVGHNTEFNALRARKHLEQITSVGPRPVGSVENEVLTVNYLLEQVEQIRTASAGGHHAITVDVQRPTGSFSIDFLGGFTSYYDRVTNVAVRLEPKAGAEHLVLANCHFDSVANSPGASDDAVSCAIMLEVLRSLANVSTPLTHGVVFLFNGAEENVLQASHGFITQHPWAKQVRTFVNLEAAGVGGKEVVFQTGPENPWLVQAYVHAAKHPFASVVGQEVFQSGIIPSDTDFRIYRDFGNIPGIDLAFIENGFIYHTRYDTSNRIMTESIQRAGDNILSLLKHLLTSDMLADASEYRHGNMVFFDVLGVLMVAYPARVGSILNYMTVAAACLYLGKKCSRTSSMGVRYVRALACACCVALLGWFVMLLFVLIIAVLLTLMGVSMFWYTHFYAAVLLYGSAAVGKMLLIHTLAKNLYYGSVRRLELAEMFFDVSLVLWCCVLLFFTLRGLCSAYVPMLMVAFPLITKLLLSFQVTHTGVSLPYAVFYLSGLTLPYLHLSFLIWVVFEIFTPILGRSGTEIPPDVVLASLVTVATVILSSYLLHLVYLASSTRRVLTTLLSVFLLMLFLVSCGLFFPYSADPSSPRPKRVVIQHTTRVFHALDGSVQHSDSGFWINSFDYTAMRHVTPHVPEINDSARSRCRDDVPFCGFPWFLPVKFLIKKNWYVAAPAVSPKSPVEFRLASRQETEWGTLKLSFEAAGPSHMSLYVLPAPGVSLTSWSFGDGSPQYDLNGEYFVFYSHGLEAPNWKFWLEFQPPPEQSGEDSVASVAVASHYFFGDERRTPDLELLLHKLPDWTFPSSWVSTYHLYRY